MAFPFGPENREHPGGVLHSLPNPVPVTIPRASLCCPTYSGTWDFSTIQTLDQRRIGNLVTCYVSCSDHWRIGSSHFHPFNRVSASTFGVWERSISTSTIDYRDQSAVPFFSGKPWLGSPGFPAWDARKHPASFIGKKCIKKWFPIIF